MRWLSFRLLLSGALVLAGLTATTAEDKKDVGFKPVFDGKDLKGWKVVLGGNETEPGTTFTVRDGALVISGRPNGYCVTEQSFKNYVIKYDWMYVRPKDLDDEQQLQLQQLIASEGQQLPKH